MMQAIKTLKCKDQIIFPFKAKIISKEFSTDSGK